MTKHPLTREQLITWLHQNAGGAQADAIAAMLTADACFRSDIAILSREHEGCRPDGCTLACDLRDMLLDVTGGD